MVKVATLRIYNIHIATNLLFLLESLFNSDSDFALDNH